MSETKSSSSVMLVPIVLLVIGVLVAVALWWILKDQNTLLCDEKQEKTQFFLKREMLQGGEALGVALCKLIIEAEKDDKKSDQALVAQVILDNFRETRSNAARWSGVYWGFTFTAAALSALAALILKLESLIKNEGAKKDIAAILSVVAALFMTISTGGDFQRKWQANRIAAAELEHTGYEFLEKNAENARSYLERVGQILLRRHMAIVGGTEERKPSPESAKTASPGKQPK